MNYITEFRNAKTIKNILKAFEKLKIPSNAKINIMEVCGGQTHVIQKYKLEEIIPEQINLLSGPGCPVCVTPISYIDKSIKLAEMKDVIVFTFGDLIRVPGTHTTLEKKSAEIGDKIKSVYTPLDAIRYAEENRNKEIVFLGIGFETTLPGILLTIKKAKELKLKNYTVLLSAKRVPPALEALLSNPKIKINGFITPGHVTTIIGNSSYNNICKKYNVPTAAGGFEPTDLLYATLELTKLILNNKAKNINCYKRAVTDNGNKAAQKLIDEMTIPVDDEFRGIGIIPNGGFGLKEKFSDFNAEKKFDLSVESKEPRNCICGLVLCGIKKPYECKLFGKKCTPDTPIGSCMVSSEGACNAYYIYQ